MTLGEGDEFENPNAEPDPEEAAAVKIQAMHRGNAARKEMNANGADAAGDDAETEAAAIKIQAMHRGNAARKQASEGGEGAEEGVPPEEGEEAQVEVAPLVRRRRFCARLLTCRACLTRHSCWCSLL